jgi:hypothetical protein
MPESKTNNNKPPHITNPLYYREREDSEALTVLKDPMERGISNNEKNRRLIQEMT